MDIYLHYYFNFHSIFSLAWLIFCDYRKWYLSNFLNLKIIDISYNHIINVKSSGISSSYKITNQHLKFIYMDSTLIKPLTVLKNDRIEKNIRNTNFYNALFLLIKSNLTYTDCVIQFNFLKNNIFLNLVYSYQIDSFLLNCNNIDFLNLN